MPTPGHLALTPEIDAFRRQFEQLSAEADALVDPLSDEQFTWHPSPEAWSIAQCIDHLNVTARFYLTFIDEAIADAIRRGHFSEGPFRYHIVGRLLVALTEPPSRLRGKARPALQPGPPRRRQEIMAAFRAYQVQYIDRLRQANGLDLARARVSTPMAAWLRMSLGSAFALMAAHERRHLWQARRITSSKGFPARPDTERS
jgi:hypothetical protein